ncbi:MAG: DUF4340 domain-containing protein [Pseudomonadota bacterium]
MKVKKEYIILAVLIVALSLYLAFYKRDRTHYKLPQLSQVPITEITRFDISRPDGTILLEKKNDKWVFSPEGYAADAGRVRDMLDAIGKLTLTALVSESKSYERYDLDKGKRITVKAWAGDSLRREVDVGKTAPSYRHTFVKIAGDDRVYHARDDFRGRFDRSVEDLRDKTVLKFAEAEIGRVEIHEGKGSLTLMRKEAPVEVKAGDEGKDQGAPSPKVEPAWQTSEGKAVNESKLKTFLMDLSNLKCTAYVYDRKKTDLADPIYTLHLTGSREYTLSIFSKRNQDEKAYPAFSSENDSPFLLSEAQAKRIMVPVEEMLAKGDQR